MYDAQILQILGLAYLVIGVGMLFNPRYYRHMVGGFRENRAIAFMGGLMALIMGLAIIVFHNVWVPSVAVLVTALGWLSLVKGVALLVFPDFQQKIMEKMLSSETSIRSYGTFVIILGSVVSYIGLYMF